MVRFTIRITLTGCDAPDVLWLLQPQWQDLHKGATAMPSTTLLREPFLFLIGEASILPTEDALRRATRPI